MIKVKKITHNTTKNQKFDKTSDKNKSTKHNYKILSKNKLVKHKDKTSDKNKSTKHNYKILSKNKLVKHKKILFVSKPKYKVLSRSSLKNLKNANKKFIEKEQNMEENIKTSANISQSKFEEDIKNVHAFQDNDNIKDKEDEILPAEKKIPSKISLTPEQQEDIRQFFFKVFKEVRDTQQTSKRQADVCPNCGGKIIIDLTTGEEFCEKCGNIIDISINTGQEWRAFDFNQLVSRTRAQASKSIHHADGIGSMVGRGSVDIKHVPAYKQKEYYRLHKWQMMIVTTIERNLQMAYGELLRMQRYFDLPFYITEEIKLLYKKLITEKVVRGRAREQILGALLYIVMRKHKTPLTFSEIAKYFGIDNKKINITYKLIFQTIGFCITPVRIDGYFNRFAKLVILNAESRKRVDKLYNLAKSKRKNNDEKNAVVDAAALVLIAAYEQNPSITPDIFLSLKGDDITLINLKKSVSLFVKDLKLNYDILNIFK